MNLGENKIYSYINNSLIHFSFKINSTFCLYIK